MTAAIRQFFETTNSGSSAPGAISGSFSNATLTGSTIVIIYSKANDNGDVALTVADTRGNSYSRTVDVADTGVGNARLEMFYSGAALPLAPSDTITVSGGNAAYTEMLVMEVTGLTSTPLISSNGSLQTGVSGSASNNLTTGNIASGGGNVFVILSSNNTTITGTAPFYPAVGTGFTQGGTWFTLAGSALASWGYGTFVAPGTTAYHATSAAGSSNDNYLTFATAFAVAPASPLTISTTSPLNGGNVGSAYNTSLVATGGTTPYTWTVTSGTLPVGLTLSSTGVISGTPSATSTSTVSISVTDVASSAVSKSFSITISAAAVPLVISNSSPLPAGIVGSAYSQTFTATGGTSPYTWSVTSGTLPGGISLSSTGLFSGTPTTAGAYTPTIKITDSTGASTSSTFSITINPALSITNTSPLTSGVVSTSYTNTLTAANGTGPYTWSVSSGSLPAGFTLSSTGVLSGSSSNTSTSSIGITVTDSLSATSTKTFSFSVTYAPSLGSAIVWWLTSSANTVDNTTLSTDNGTMSDDIG